MDAVHKKEGKMEGWLFLIKSNRFGMHNIRKRYFILEDFYLKSFNSIPRSCNLPIGNVMIDSCIRVADNGKRIIHNKAFFFFTLYLTSNHKEQLQLGSTSIEEAGRWIHILKDSSLKTQCPHSDKNISHFSSKNCQSIKTNRSRRAQSSSSIDCIPCSSTNIDAFTSHVNTPSTWKIINCVNGLRIFKEAKRGILEQLSNGHPSIMAVGVVDGTPEDIFHTLMSLGSSRSEWDFCFYKGSVIEHIDDHTDIIHKQLDREWLPWGMQPRDFLVRRHWRKYDAGTYVIQLSSVIHKNCPPKSNYIRASLKSGGYIITPTNSRKQSVVKHMLAIEWKSWRSQFVSSIARSTTIKMLERVAALREMFKEKSGCNINDNYQELIKDIEIPEAETRDSNDVEANLDLHLNTGERNNVIEDKVERSMSSSTSVTNMEDEADKFFDVPEPTVIDNFENEWLFRSSGLDSKEPVQPRIPSGGKLKLKDTSDKKKVELQIEDISCKYGSTLPMDPTLKLPCSCAEADPCLFSVRGENYLRNQQKIKASTPMMQLVGADWMKSDKGEDEVAQRPGGIVEKYATQGGSEFFIVVNLQVPGVTTYNLALYYMTKAPLEDNQLLERFVNGDDTFRNSRFKLIPYISKGSWIVKQSVRRKPCLLGKALDVKYSRGRNYLELAVDVGSSKVARRVVNLVIGYVTNLVVELAFLIQGNTEEELPERLLGTCRLSHLDTAKAKQLP